MAVADVILETLIGRVERFADGHREIPPGLPIDRDLRSRDADVNAHPDAPLQGMLAGTVHADATFLDSGEEMSQLVGPLCNVLGKAGSQKHALVEDPDPNGHPASKIRVLIKTKVAGSTNGSGAESWDPGGPGAFGQEDRPWDGPRVRPYGFRRPVFLLLRAPGGRPR